jgi:hypothetical protein
LQAQHLHEHDHHVDHLEVSKTHGRTASHVGNDGQHQHIGHVVRPKPVHPQAANLALYDKAAVDAVKQYRQEDHQTDKAEITHDFKVDAMGGLCTEVRHRQVQESEKSRGNLELIPDRLNLNRAKPSAENGTRYCNSGTHLPSDHPAQK